MVSQYDVDLYILSRLDAKLGQPKINANRIKKFASRLGISLDTIDKYLDFRTCCLFKPQAAGVYTSIIDSNYGKDPLNWERPIAGVTYSKKKK